MDKKILIWGAGKIGRGFVADIFHAAGYRIVFADADQHVVELLNTRNEYKVLKYKSEEDLGDSVISNYEALNISETEALIAHAMSCEVMAVAVFPGALEALAKDFAKIISKRVQEEIVTPLDIIMCANVQGPSDMLRGFLLVQLNEKEKQHFESYIGLIDSIVIRISVQPTEAMIKDDPLVVLTNGYEPLTIDGTSVKGKLKLPGIALSNKIHAEEVRKMYTYNMVHALYAYLGFSKGYVFVEECCKDTEIQQCAIGALEEIGAALKKIYGFADVEMNEWNANVLKNMANPILKDKVDRIGADVMRKLARHDRLTGPAVLCKDNGVMPYYLTKAIGYAFMFDPSQNKNDAIVKEFAEYYGVKKAAEKYCGLEKEPELLQLISDRYEEAKTGDAQDSELILQMKKAYAMGFDAEKKYKGCAQCTLLAMMDMTGMESAELFKSATGFSGGMAISGDGVCGGYAGGIMFMGYLVGRRLEEMKKDGDKQAQYQAYEMSQQLRDKYIQTYGSVICADVHEAIFGESYCLRTKAVRDEFEAAGAHTNKCTNTIGMACAWVSEILFSYGLLN